MGSYRWMVWVGLVGLWMGLVGVLWPASSEAAPVWRSQTADLPETDIRSVQPVAGTDSLLAATPRHLYRFLPESRRWKSVLGVRTPDEAVEIVADPKDDKSFWLVTRRTLRHSSDGGRTWKTVFRRDSESGFQIRTAHPDNDGSLLAGTTQGLFRLHLPDSQWTPVEGAPRNISIDSIVRAGDRWMIGSSRGIYRADSAFQSWELLNADLRREPEGEEGALGQFAIEEIASTPVFANAVVWPGSGNIFLGRADGLYEASRDAINRLSETNGFKIRRVATDERFLYLATDRGVYRMTPDTKSVENISQGLESLDVSTIATDPRTGSVWAGTRKGLFQLDASEIAPMMPQLVLAPGLKENPQIPSRPAVEPTIAEIQLAAVRYAEVSPEKIRAWREAAAKKAWLPTVSFDTDFGEDHNVDIDRGGTNDPDKFIIGPNESNLDWSVGVSWDLGDLIWNNDQTSIDVRSRLMVELRNDILNDVTHLYFERRRAQTELESLPPDVPKLRFEKQLKLEELTAQIDALTGGYLSRRLSGGEGVR